VLELGRSVTASCGYVPHERGGHTKSNPVPTTPSSTAACTQLVYYAHAMAMRLPPVHVLGQEQDAADVETDEWNVCGALCTTSDILAKRLARVQPQDRERAFVRRRGLLPRRRAC